jgi:hypothetical protein
MTSAADAAFTAGFTTFIITSLAWGLIWAIATIVRLSNEKDKRDRKDL